MKTTRNLDMDRQTAIDLAAQIDWSQTPSNSLAILRVFNSEAERIDLFDKLRLHSLSNSQSKETTF